jgi:2-phospho-L-lactate guanylyltransferase (CobY/MobA/RfbA family)
MRHCFEALFGSTIVDFERAAAAANSTPQPPSLGKRRGLPEFPLSFQERGLGGEFDRVIMIGSDVPHVRDAAIDEAERHLDDHDVVLGPSQDGGYYLIALRQPRDLFSMVEMGTPKVLERTLEVIRSAGLDAYLLPPDFDIDEEDDLRRLRDLLTQPGAPQLPHTTRVLNEITLRQ